jgi:hypothetical protein
MPDLDIEGAGLENVAKKPPIQPGPPAARPVS